MGRDRSVLLETACSAAAGLGPHSGPPRPGVEAGLLGSLSLSRGFPGALRE